MIRPFKAYIGALYRDRSAAKPEFIVWPYVGFQSKKILKNKTLSLASLLVASVAFFIAIGFVASSHAASLARPQAEAPLAPTGIASFTPAMVVGVGLWGALARRRRAKRAARAHGSLERAPTAA
jgi:protein-S-isoprenylcysteine O-methyltransferase Ste14